ncbi:hypothetical protein HHI36_017233, partial [Cryptolaemus montrouzieri]
DVRSLGNKTLGVANRRFVNINGHKQVASYSRTTLIDGGCSIFVKCEVEAVEYPGLKQFCQDVDIECTCAVSHMKKLVIICIYRTPS